MATILANVRRATVKTPAPRRMRKGPRFFLYAYLVLLALFALLPLVLAWFTAFKSGDQLVTNPYGPPLPPTMENLEIAWTVGRFSHYFRNSVIVSVAAVVIMVTVSSLAGYSLARIRFKGRKAVLGLLLFGLTIPVAAIILPLYIIMRDFGLLNTYASVVLSHVALGTPIFTFIMHAFFRGLPKELEDAARVDGCSELRVFWNIMLPLAKPGLLTVAVLEFLWTWNDLLLPLVFLTSDDVRTMPIGMLFFQGRFTVDFGLMSAGVIIISFPIIILFLFFQRSFVQGLTGGALKG
jgi:raffinose/stachyose/melibiose transport system permease protein